MAQVIKEIDLLKGLVHPFVADRGPVAGVRDAGRGYEPQADVLDAGNVLPTEYGYTSYFGTDRALGTIPITDDQLQDVLLVRTQEYGIGVMLALAPSGLYACVPGSTEASAVVEVTPTPVVDHLIKQEQVELIDGGFDWLLLAQSPQDVVCSQGWWTWAVLKNRFFLYQCGLGAILEITATAPALLTVNWFLPASIISDYAIYKWLVTAELDTAGCPATNVVTQQILDFSALDSYMVANLDKAHIAAVAPYIWQAKLLNLTALNMTLI